MVEHKSEFQNRPDNTAFTQQRLPAWQPMLSAGIIIPGFVVIGVAFIGIGVALFVTSRNIDVLELDYTGSTQTSPCFRCSNPDIKNCNCSLEFSLSLLFKVSTAFSMMRVKHQNVPKAKIPIPPLNTGWVNGFCCHPQGPVFFYYGLSNYFQNYRKYGASKDADQLFGDLDNFKSPAEECAPYQFDSNNKPIVPCGALANSMFNDSFTLYQIVNGKKKQVPFDGKGIAWWTDYNVKYRNPSVTPLRNAFNNTVKPLFWSRPAYELDPDNSANNGFINQDFLVWMRRAALPDFRKLYRRITEGDYTEGLPAGNYSIEISYNYPVLSFDGKKKVVLSNVSWMGGKNEFLGIAYLVIGSLCVVMSIVMLIVYAKFKFPEEN